MSWRKLAELTYYDPSWLSKVRHGSTPSAELVRRCDEVLEAGGCLVALASVEQARRPGQLPAARAGFVGRSTELARIRAALTQEGAGDTLRIVTIEGPPGVGKTSTALNCSQGIVASRDDAYYSDGQLYADLRGYSPEGVPVRPDDVLEEFLVSLGVAPDDVPASGERRSALYRSLLASRAVLVVLDNAASSAQVEPLLPGGARCGVLVTSRRRLVGLSMRVGVERVVLGVMTREESIEVLRVGIGDARADVEEPELGTLAERCGYLPLALRIAAERVAAHPHSPLRELVDELAVGRRRLDALATGDAVPVREVFDWSFRGLSDAEAGMFQLLGLHPGPQVSVHAAAALAGTPVVRTRHLLETLSQVHLLYGVDHGRYELHDLLRHYATERLKAVCEVEQERAVDRLSSWYLHTAAAANRAVAPFRLKLLELSPASDIAPLTFYDDQAALRWCDIEAPVFESVIRLAAHHGMNDTAWKLAVVLFEYHRLLRHPRHLWLAAATSAQQAARDSGDPAAEAWVEITLAEALRRLGRLDDAQRLFEHALSVRREIRDRHGEAWALAGLGSLAIDQGRPGEAHNRALEAFSRFEEVHDRHGQASALITVADAFRMWRRNDYASQVLLRALKIFAGIGDQDAYGLTLAKMAEIHRVRGDHERALDHLDRSLRARRLAGSRWGEADALARRGHILTVLGRAGEARESWAAAAVAYEHLHDSRAANIRAYLCGSRTEPVLCAPGW